MDWLPGWWGPLVCVAWGMAIGIIGTLIYADRRVWVDNERGRHRGAPKQDDDQGSG
jgi:hypothetical protein